MRARTSCLTTLRWRSLARFRRPFHARLAKASAAPVAPLLSIGSPLLDTRQNICSRWEAVNYALSSISGNHVSIYCVELYGGTFALEWLPYINSQSTNPAWLKAQCKANDTSLARADFVAGACGIRRPFRFLRPVTSKSYPCPRPAVEADRGTPKTLPYADPPA